MLEKGKAFFGPRVFKTALATTLSVMLATMAGMHAPNMAGIAAIVSMTTTVYDSYTVSFNRVLSTLIGALIGTGLSYFGWVNYVMIFFSIILIINICNAMGWKKAITLAIIVFLGTILTDRNNSAHSLHYGLDRMLSTMIGLFVGFAVNRLIIPPDRFKQLMLLYEQAWTMMRCGVADYIEKDINFEPEALYQIMDDIAEETKAIQKDKRFHLNKNVNITLLRKTNALFYHAASFVAGLEDHEKAPALSEENYRRLGEWLGRPLACQEKRLSDAYDKAFNYYMDDYLDLMSHLKTQWENLRENSEKKSENITSLGGKT